jgi:predicted metal-dependent hydrolase
MKSDPQPHTIVYGNREIFFKLHRNRRKRLKIVVTPELDVDVFAPHDATQDQVLAAVYRKAPWISQKLDRLASYHPLPAPKQYISGETLLYLGRQYRLHVEKGKKQTAKLTGRYLTVCVENKSNRQDVKGAIDKWYRIRSQHTLGRYLAKCQAITRRHGISEPKLMIRKMKRRWGSCSPAGRITLNLKLIQVPIHCIEYVIMHELCHLKCHNHSKAFYALLTRCQPDWRKRKAALDRFRLS